MKDCMATEIMMDKDKDKDSDTETKTLWGEDPDKKKSMLCFQLFELLSFQSTVLLAFAVLTLFWVESKNIVNYRMFPHAVWLNLFCLNY